MTLVGIATSRLAWESDDDAPLLVDALRRVGLHSAAAIWDDGDVDWSRFDLVVIRSTWDYAPRRDEFVRWARNVESVTPLLNQADVVDWNTDKRYLAELEADGVAIVPTCFHAAAAPSRDLMAVADMAREHGEIVVKPTVSAGSLDTTRHGASDADAAVNHAAHLLDAGRDVMVQPYVVGVDSVGETGLVYFDGELSHGFRKAPLLTPGGGRIEGLFALENIDPRDPSPAERDAGEAVMDAVRHRFDRELLYSRVDLLPDASGQPLLLELELTEPSFFLSKDPDSAGRIASAIRRRLP